MPETVRIEVIGVALAALPNSPLCAALLLTADAVAATPLTPYQEADPDLIKVSVALSSTALTAKLPTDVVVADT